MAGIVLTAVGVELVIAHPDDALGTAGAVVTLGGPALYLLGLMAFGARVGRLPALDPPGRGGGAGGRQACWPPGPTGCWWRA